MIFWCSGSGVTFDWPCKLIPWYEKPRGGASRWMIDSGVKAEPPTVEQLLEKQAQYADVAVSPDILGDPVATAERTRLWWPEIRRRRPQAETVLATQGTVDDRLRLMDEFPDSTYVGLGLWCRAPGVEWKDTDRERTLRAMVPEIHARGKRVHVFGIGCRRLHMEWLRELGVDSFDSSALVRAAVCGRVLDASCRQIRVGGPKHADAKRLRLYLSLANLSWAIDNGPEGAEQLELGFLR